MLELLALNAVILIGIVLLPLRRAKGRSAPQGLKPANKG